MKTDDPLAEKRLSDARRVAGHLVELYKSGRWRNHYTEEGFLARAREVQSAITHWETVVRREH